jgi:lysozyme family protein
MISEIITALLDKEGGWVNHPADRGGATNFGITQGTLTNWLGREATLTDLQNLTPEVARAIYIKQYIEGPGFATLQVPDFFRSLLIDFGVNSGPILAITKVQEILHLPVDGILGPLTKAAIEGADPTQLCNKLVISRLQMIGRIVSRNPSQAPFASGWINRACSFYQP